MWSWLSRILLGSGGVGQVAKDVGSVFAENREAAGQRSHEHDMAALEQFAAEFVARQQRTWWDSFIDGLNRLPRPLIALMVWGGMVYVPFWPERALEVAQVYSAMPDGLWLLLGTIVAFYFGSRAITSSQDFAVKKGAVEVVKAITAKRAAEAAATAAVARAAETVAAEPVRFRSSTTGNAVIDRWLARKAA
jgi:hypothetical protein